MVDSARFYLRSQMAAWGLSDYRANDGRLLSDWAWERYLETGDVDVVLLELRQQKGFKERFPAYEQLAKEGRALTPDQYISYEQTYMALLQQYGVPDGIFDDPEHVSKMLLNNVSAAELSERLALNAQAMYSAPQEVRDALADMYGVGPNGMLAYYLDPDEALPKLQQQFASAQIRGAVVEAGFDLQRAEAERYAALGYTYQQAREASQNAAEIRGLMAEGLSEGQLLGAQFGDVDSRRAVFRAAAGRQARFSAGGQAVVEQEGVTGLAGASAS